MVSTEYRDVKQCRGMENARLYSASNALQRTDARRVLQEVIETLPLKPGARVLDVGCGSGDVTAEVLLPFLPTDVEEVIGVDVSERMVFHARKAYQNPRLSFMQMDFEEDLKNNNNGKDSVDILINGLHLDDMESEKNCGNFALDEGKFDAVFSFYCLHWIQNQRQALSNIFYVLKNGGEAVLVLLAHSTIFSLYEKLAQKDRWSSYMKDYKKFISPYCTSKDPAHDFSELASSVGFQVVSVECQKQTFTYRDKAAIIEAIKAVNPFYTRLTATDGEIYLNDCLETVKTYNLAETVKEGYRVNYTLLVARLRKC